MSETISAAEIIALATAKVLREDNSSVVMGLGVNDPKRVFGTTTGLVEEFGEKRVIETPTAENAMTGVAVGLALANRKVITVHQRLDFFLLAMDQLINSAAKWQYMFGNNTAMNLTIRLIIGRGWGQGPTHSQNLASWFAHIPGLKVIAFSFADDVHSLFTAAVCEPGPTLILEDRWIHHQLATRDSFEANFKSIGASVRRNGLDLTLVTYGYFVIESMAAANVLMELEISIEIVDLRWLKPLDHDTIRDSVAKTKRIVVYEPSHSICSIGSEVISRLTQQSMDLLVSNPVQIAYPEIPEPTSHGVIGDYIPRALFLVEKIASLFDKSLSDEQRDRLRPEYFDSPNPEFKGPF